MGFFGSGNDDGWNAAREGLAANRELYGEINLPDYDEYVPEQYTTDSYNYNLIGEDPALKSKQLSNLNMLEQLSKQGLGAEDELGYMKARELGSQQANAGTQAAIANANARGVGGGGLEFAMREIANQGGAQRSQAAGLEQAAAAARQRALQAQAYTNALASTRDQDARTATANTNIMNDFNAKNTAQRNQTAASNVDLRNGAFQYNQGLKDKNYQNQIGKADRIAGMNNQATQLSLAQQDQEAKQRNADINQYMGLAGMGLSAYSANRKKGDE